MEENKEWAIDVLVGIAICRYRPGLKCGSCPRFKGWMGIHPDCDEPTVQQVQDAILALRPELSQYATIVDEE